MSGIKAWIYLAAIFTTGGVSGAALTYGISSHFAAQPAPSKGHLLFYLTKRLQLTDAQQAKIGPELADAEAQIAAVRHKAAESVAQIFETTYNEITPDLTPDQVSELQKMETEMEQTHEGTFPGHKGPWGAPRGGPGVNSHRDHLRPDNGTNDTPHDPDADVLTNPPPTSIP